MMMTNKLTFYNASQLKLAWLLLLPILAACARESALKPLSNGVIPNPVTQYQVESLPGSALIKFQLPKSDNLLYVKAVYETSPGKKQEARTSIYKNTLLLEGFASAGNHLVHLYSVGAGEEQSEPVPLSVKVLDPPYIKTRNGLKAESYFGGIRLMYQNETKANLQLHVFSLDKKTNTYTRDFTAPINKEKDTLIIRGYKPVETSFRIYITDRWSNNSDTLSLQITPQKEELKISKSSFAALNLPGDTYLPYQGNSCYTLSNIWNDVLDQPINSGYKCNTHFWSEANSGLPQHFSFDMGRKVQVTRFKYFQVMHAYSYANPKVFELFGSNSPDWGGSWTGWQKIGQFTSVKPTAGPWNWDDVSFGQLTGEEFRVPEGTPAFRYYRWNTKETHAASTNVHIAELTFWGFEGDNL